MPAAQSSTPRPASEDTLQHLWHASHVLLSTAPTAARHLASTLVAAAGGPSGLSQYAQRQHCPHCGSLADPGGGTATVRIRPAKRRAHAPCNHVVRGCATCGRRGIWRGAERVNRVEIGQRARAQRIDVPTTRKGGDSNKLVKSATTMTTGRVGKNKRKGQTSAENGRLGKRRRSSAGSLMTAASGSTPARKGLAASFLFEDVDE